ncbi:MAG: tyrosine-type recombinase/integrase [Phycisphaerae bacterium]|jgi:site-specific recombinase XerD
MARKEDRTNRWIKSERVGEVTLFRTSRSPYWQMYWTESVSGQHGPRIKQQQRSTRETDIGLARQVASRQSEALYRRKHYPERERERKRTPLRPIVEDFVQYLETLGRSHGHISKLKGRLHCLADWLERRQVINVQDVSATLLRDFQSHLRSVRNVGPATVNHYIAGIHNFYGYAIYKRKLLDGPNPAATGRQAELDKLPTRSVPPPTIYPDQVNAVIQVARKHNDTQIANLIAFVCEGGFRFQEMQFLQVGDINVAEREIILEVKRPDPHRVRAELRRTCLTEDGLWIPKTPAARRPIHITDRLARVIGAMGLGDASDWVFMNQAGNQISENKTLSLLKRYALEAKVLVDAHPKTGKPWSLLKWHWLRHYHRTRAHVSRIRREVSKLAMGHAADPIHDHYRGLDRYAFHEEYEKFDSGIDDALFARET